jgi:hypothetical protein
MSTKMILCLANRQAKKKVEDPSVQSSWHGYRVLIHVDRGKKSNKMEGFVVMLDKNSLG